MSLVLQPQASFTVVRQIANHLDSATYYVRAVIRNAYTDDVIDTLNLEDKTGQRFKRNWQVPADTSGQGFYISIVTSVYTDADYTTKSENYGDEENTYLIQDRVLASVRGGGGGVDARTVQRIVENALKKALEPGEEPEKEEVKTVAPAEPRVSRESKDRTPEVLDALKALTKKVDAIPTDKTDLSPLVSATGQAIRAIQEKEITPATDLGEVVARLEDIASELTVMREELPASVNETSTKNATDVVEAVKKVLATATFSIAPTTASMTLPKGKEQEEPLLDIEKLTS